MSAEQWQADQLAAAARATQAAPPVWWGVVQAVNNDSVTVRGLGSDRTSVRCVASYWPRTVGDRVLVEETSAGPVVVASIEPPVVHPQLDGVTFATAAPSGSQWVAPSAVWVDPTTRQVVYVVPSGVGTTVPPSTLAAPAELTATATAMATYRSGALLHEQYAEQGQYAGAGSGNQTGVFWFAAGAFAALSGRTVLSRTAAIHRRAASHGNTWGPVPVTLWTHASPAGAPATPTLGGIGVVLGEPRLGESAAGGIPADYVTTLIAGGGLAIYDASTANNVEADACTVTVTYQ